MSGKGDTQRPAAISKCDWDSSYQRTFTVSSSDTTLTILRQLAHQRLVALTAYCNRPEYSERYAGTFCAAYPKDTTERAPNTLHTTTLDDA